MSGCGRTRGACPPAVSSTRAGILLAGAWMVAACGGDEVGTGSRGMAGASGEAGSAGTLVAATGGTMSAPPPMEDDYPFLCNGPGQSCTDSAECCNKNCVGGKCMAKQCVGPGTACMGDADCCDGGVCRGGTCAPADSMCRTDGSLCAAPADCCSTNCLEGKCAPTGAMAMCDMTFGPCDTFPACGCGDGETCHVVDFDTGTRACKPNGTAGAYQACTDTYGCAAGHVCVGDECKQYCQEDRHCPTTHPRCAPVGRSASESIPGFDVCWM